MTEPFGKYTLQQRLAIGGMAEIFLARLDGMEGFHKHLVVKRILPNYVNDGDFVSMFLDEAKLAAQLEHPNIVQVFELGSVSGSLFMAMELVPGLDLGTLVRRMNKHNERLRPNVTMAIVLAALRGLHYAHEKRDDAGNPLAIVHRDVSPSNILISRSGYVKVTDFGIAKAEYRATKTRSGVLKGKFGYMAPEHAQGRPVDRRSDLFAMGLIAYELFAGHAAYDEDEEHELFQRALAGRVLPLGKVMPDNFPGEVADVIDRALATRPEDRFRSCAEFAAELARVGTNAFGTPAEETELANLVVEYESVDTGPVFSVPDSDIVTIERDRQTLEKSAKPSTTIEMSRASRPSVSRWRVVTVGVVVLAAIAAVTWLLVSPRNAPPVAIAPALPPDTPDTTTTPITSPPAATPAEPEKRVEPAPIKPVATTRVKAARAAALQKGTLTLTSKPWANVWIDGKDLKLVTPVIDLPLSVGKHRVRLESPGAKRSEAFEIDIKPNETTKKFVVFTPGAGQ